MCMHSYQNVRFDFIITEGEIQNQIVSKESATIRVFGINASQFESQRNIDDIKYYLLLKIENMV
jgi:uncharacterized membrane protein YjgN (DUF898 family)